jgi:hypothetical protein
MTIHDEAPTERVPFLHKLTDTAMDAHNVHDSFIHARLSQILDDDNLRYKLLSYLRATQPPAELERSQTQLHFLMTCREIQRTIASAKSSGYAGGDGEPEAKVRAHISWQCWELYKAYLVPIDGSKQTIITE